MNSVLTIPKSNASEASRLTRLRLDTLPLPAISDSDDKENRGVVLGIGGSVQVPGAIMLSGVAALRAGAGKLQLATTRNAAIQLGIAVPESLVVSLPVARYGEIDPTVAAKLLRKPLTKANAVLIGPGMINEQYATSLVRRLWPAISHETILVLDGVAILALSDDEELVHGRDCRTIITPHAGEMASLLDIPIEEVRENGAAVAQHCATRFDAVVVLKGGETWIAHPSLPMLHYRDGKAGLGTSGSGDVLAGIITGLAARGAAPQTAAAWGVWTHGSAGNKLTRSVGKLGFLASELLGEIPRIVND